jgi:hypothetical protein
VPAPALLSVIELGGYPDFRPLYERLGYATTVVGSVRKAIAELRRAAFDVVVAEFNFQSDFRDRTSSLETLLAVLARTPATKLIVFYDPEHARQLAILTARFPVHATLAHPIRSAELEAALHTKRAGE